MYKDYARYIDGTAFENIDTLWRGLPFTAGRNPTNVERQMIVNNLKSDVFSSFTLFNSGIELVKNPLSDRTEIGIVVTGNQRITPTSFMVRNRINAANYGEENLNELSLDYKLSGARYQVLFEGLQTKIDTGKSMWDGKLFANTLQRYSDATDTALAIQTAAGLIATAPITVPLAIDGAVATGSLATRGLSLLGPEYAATLGTRAAATGTWGTTLVKGGIGLGTYLLIEDDPTIGGAIGSTAVGAVLSPYFEKFAYAGGSFTLRVASAGGLDAVANGLGNFGGQLIDIQITPGKDISVQDLLSSALGGLLGGGGGALVPKNAANPLIAMLPSKIANYESVWQGLATKYGNGVISEIASSTGRRMLTLNLAKLTPDKLADISGDIFGNIAKPALCIKDANGRCR